jgi:hypothetical protein
MAPAFPAQERMYQVVGSMLERLNPQSFAPVIQQLTAGSVPAASSSLPEALGKTFEQLIASLEGKIEQKLDLEQAPVAGKKRKKKGGLGKLKKKFKSVSKFATKALKSATKPLQKSLTTFLSTLKKGDIFQLGQTLAGGLIGGPVGGFVLEKLMRSGGRNNPIQQGLKQVHKALDLVQSIHQQRTDLQKSMLPFRYRG